MKRLFAALCALLLLIPALALADSAIRGYDRAAGYQYVVMGTYPQEADGTVLPILWRVLSVRDGEAFLFSEYILTNGYVHPDFSEYVAFGHEWNKTFLFDRLNGEFAQTAFTEAERARLREDEELGMVFLVSSGDLIDRAMGFQRGGGGNQARQGFGTPYALANGLFQYGREGNYSSPYWTRTPSINTSSTGNTRCIKKDGTIGYIRCTVEDEGIRPAVRLMLDAEPFAGGQGTIEDPFYF